MTDFRVEIVPTSSNQDFMEELDWSNDKRSWPVSEKEMYGTSWLQDLSPSVYQLENLVDFSGSTGKEFLLNLLFI